MTNFVGLKVSTKNKAMLMQVKEHKNEILREWVNHFNMTNNAFMAELMTMPSWRRAVVYFQSRDSLTRFRIRHQRLLADPLHM